MDNGKLKKELKSYSNCLTSTSKFSIFQVIIVLKFFPINDCVIRYFVLHVLYRRLEANYALID